MAKFVLTNVRLFAAGADLTGNSNKVEISAELEDKDVTSFGSNGWKELLGGLASSSFSCEGQWEAGDPGKVDDVSWSRLGDVDPWSAGPVGAAVGDLAYFTAALRSSYGLGDAVGEVAPWSGEALSSWPLVRGQVAHPPGTARTATGSGTGMNMGALSTGQRLYAALHVLSVAGTSTPTITARIESDVDNTFSTPATQLSFAAATAVGGQVLRTDGTAITDAWQRVAWTITGTSPSFMFVVALGIG